MIIYMRHERHGNKIAMCELEAQQDEENGWTRYDAGALMTPEEPAPVVEYVETIEDLRERWEQKFGKKPHHKKTAETLRKELGDGNSTGFDNSVASAD